MLNAAGIRRYNATGAYHASDGGEEGHAFEWRGFVEFDGNAFVVEGSYRHRIAGLEYPFHIELAASAAPPVSGRFYLHCPHLNDAAGSFRAAGRSLFLGGRAAGIGAAMSLAVEESPSGALEGSGALIFASGRVWLARFQALPAKLREPRAKVVDLHSGESR